jgi:lipid II:glycine glycyltransferase (peptidoglycan interpeptide bridge formation enzyme)
MHPAALPRNPHDFTSRALYEDMETAFGQNAALRWKDLALDELLPTNEEQELKLKAEQARKMASGAQANNAAAQQQEPRNGGEQHGEEEEEEEEWEEEPSSAISEYASPEGE